ncbi:hypothetical protein [Tardiphaga sp. 42S5]|uniref:hypothetical protein n=1 Tax=Tardiphaga sp. 42S5 TaxID=1404799 RepID=UPI002A5A17AD|nr:hypothetical protein [Tardiphaga sp. 42S5]WPO43398.1 hypothetical protein SFY93_09725 [Tardiphaga sp. 42S5]
MKRFAIAALPVLLIGVLVSSASAGQGQARSYESCTQLADQRGFMVSERGSTRKTFVERCMRGNQK